MLPIDDLSDVDLEGFANAQGWQQQYRLITQWGKLVVTKPLLRVDNYLIKGCEMPVWLKHTCENEQHFFWFDSDSRVINGLVVLLLVLVNGKTTNQLKTVDVQQQFTAWGLEKHITPSRNNGLKTIVAVIETAIHHP